MSTCDDCGKHKQNSEMKYLYYGSELEDLETYCNSCFSIRFLCLDHYRIYFNQNTFDFRKYPKNDKCIICNNSISCSWSNYYIWGKAD